ncbi:MAG: ROK family protein [Kiritimatiellia bacterium]|nr:ROK family protein [Kiritimatiellia bacterium]
MTNSSFPADGLPAPKSVPELDPNFRPAALAATAFEAAVLEAGCAVPVQIALEQPGGTFPFDLVLAEPAHPLAVHNARHLIRFVKFLLWSRGGFRVHVSGAKWAVDLLQKHFQTNKTGIFDADLMGRRIYEKPFEVVFAPKPVAASTRAAQALGGHTKGCRVGFDLGASDRKAAAVMDGEVIYTEEVEWNPTKATDPAWHFEQIMASLKSAASHLPRVDAIGGSSAGVIVHNRVRVASLFRSVPAEQFDSRVSPIFFELQKAWNGIPFEVANDGEVTALGAAQALNAGAVLGIALGSSEAVGYVTPDGNITPWLNELAFAPIDDRADAPPDEWSGDLGVGAQYLSQQAVNRLLKPAGIELPAGMPLPEKLVQVQNLMKAGDPRAVKIYRTIGVFLGHAVAQYARFYDIRNVLILGRVTSGEGGAILLAEAEKALQTDYPERAKTIQWHTPDERSKRHGQAVTAAGLAEVKS